MKKYTSLVILLAVIVVLGLNSTAVRAIGSPTITSISPSSVPIDSTYDATMVRVYGANFDQDSYISLDGGGITINPDSQSISGLIFHVPTSTIVGVHTLQVGERNSSLPLSNSVSLTLTVTPKAATSAEDKALLDQITSLLTQINTTKGQLATTQSATGQSTSGSSAGSGSYSSGSSASSGSSGGASSYTGGTTGSCVNLLNNLKYGMRDAKANGDVFVLQKFLQTKGYLNTNPTGFFGGMTLTAVKKFQATNGISPVAGYVGIITRTKIRSLTCGY